MSEQQNPSTKQNDNNNNPLARGQVPIIYLSEGWSTWNRPFMKMPPPINMLTFYQIVIMSPPAFASACYLIIGGNHMNMDGFLTVMPVIGAAMAAAFIRNKTFVLPLMALFKIRRFIKEKRRLRALLQLKKARQ